MSEKLIEEAAKEIDEVWQGLSSNASWAVLADVAARAALAVFEKARTPTDDEREALDYAIRCAIPNDLDYRPLWKLIRAIQDSVLAAGFRRSVVPEPSGRTLTPCGNLACTGCRVCGCPALGIDPQGEPSDAQMKAFEDEWYRLDGVTEPERHRRALRATLGAAGVGVADGFAIL